MVKVNGRSMDVDGLTVAQLIEQEGYTSAQVAVERNLEILAKSLYTQTILHDGDEIEIVCFVGGG